MTAHADELPEKYLYLTKAPKKDEEGRLTVIRFSRKTKEQYVMTENEDGKASGWKAFYQGKRWVVEEKSGKAAAKA